ncbi:MAG: amidinotransferase [Cryomorphaceae bacterium]|nr:amidinotransferase [Cryomorphaceae bacterium]|tara:strand:- start:1611 stop:2528 length:918 start_codon:yes stop_codon:yes gene_type:complete
MELNVNNETSKLLSVVLGIAKSTGPVPKIEECYDPKSRQHILNETYPKEIDMHCEMEGFATILMKHNVKVFRPDVLENYNQIFSRDIGFVIEDKFIISNILPERSREIEALSFILDAIDNKKIINLPENCHLEGGDVIVHNEYLFVGTYTGRDYSQIQTARTNINAIEYLKSLFPEKQIISFHLIKSNTDPEKNALHLDCCLQTVGKNKVVVCPEAFSNKNEYSWIIEHFGDNNILEISLKEMSNMQCNFFSISEDIVVSEKGFSKVNQWLRSFDITVEEIDYKEISKQGGLLRCSTLPLERVNK